MARGDRVADSGRGRTSAGLGGRAGPGHRRNRCSRTVVRAGDRPAGAVDADALTILAAHPDMLASRRAPTLLTPHAGEFARLAGAPPGDDRIGATRKLADALGATVLLKGNVTVIAEPGRSGLPQPGRAVLGRDRRVRRRAVRDDRRAAGRGAAGRRGRGRRRLRARPRGRLVGGRPGPGDAPTSASRIARPHPSCARHAVAANERTRHDLQSTVRPRTLDRARLHRPHVHHSGAGIAAARGVDGSRRRLSLHPRRADARRQLATEPGDVRHHLDGSPGREADGRDVRQEHDRQGRISADRCDRAALRVHGGRPVPRRRPARRRPVERHRSVDDRFQRSGDARRAGAQMALAGQDRQRLGEAARPTW